MKSTVLFLTFFFSFLSSYAEERILKFETKLEIQASGELLITEKIKVQTEGEQFKHGLKRVLPLYRKDIYGTSIPVEYHLKQVRKDDVSESYFTKEKDGDWTIYVGKKEVDLPSGIYTYELQYSTPYQIGFFENYDELYWNATGTEWDLPIDTAWAEISLPKRNQNFLQLACYTGEKGSKASNCKASTLDSCAIFTAYELNSHEGLTVSASFEKGVVSSPSASEKFLQFYRKIKGYLWSIIIGLGTALFYFLQWRRFGKDPRKTTIIPEYRPPNNWSPAMVGYLYHRETKEEIYMASIIQLAVKGCIKIKSEDDNYVIESIDAPTDTLSLEEQAVQKQLSKKKTLAVEDKNYKIFNLAYLQWLLKLTESVDLKDYYLTNARRKWIGLGFLFLAVLTYIALAKSGYVNYHFFFTIISAGFSYVFWISRFKSSRLGITILKGAIGLILAISCVPVVLFSIFFLEGYQMMVVAFMAVCYIIYAFTMGAYTEKGTIIWSQLEGFRCYLQTAEKDRMNLLNPPERTPELFEELLPYAIALGVGVEWGEQFSTILDTAKYNPAWYDGEDFSRMITRTSFIHGFSDSLNSAGVNPDSSTSSSGSSGSWSSGSSGGGSSGGGGGGGGGGGW